MAAFALLTASGRSLYPSTTRSSLTACSTHHLLQQDDQHEYQDGGQIEGNSTDAQRGKESPDGSEDRFGQVIQDTVDDCQTGKTPTARHRQQQIQDDPPKEDEPVEGQEDREDDKYGGHRSRLIEEAALLEPTSLLGRDFDVSRGQQEHLLCHWLDASVEAEREAGGEVDQALRRLWLHGLEVHDHRDVGLELVADLLGVVEARRLYDVDLPGRDRRDLMDHRLRGLVEVPVAPTDVPVIVSADPPHRRGATADRPARLRHVDQLLLLVRRLDQSQPHEALLERPGHAPHLPSTLAILRRPPRIAHRPCPPGRGPGVDRSSATQKSSLHPPKALLSSPPAAFGDERCFVMFHRLPSWRPFQRAAGRKSPCRRAPGWRPPPPRPRSRRSCPSTARAGPRRDAAPARRAAGTAGGSPRPRAPAAA